MTALVRDASVPYFYGYDLRPKFAVKEQNMDRTLRNTLIGAFITVLVAFVGAWIQLNSRISILEVQVQNDHNLFKDNGHDMKELKDKVTDIQIKVTELGTRQQQDEYGHGKEYQ